MEKVVNFYNKVKDLYEQTRKVVHATVLALTPAGVLVDRILADGQIDLLGTDRADFLSLVGIVGALVATYWSTNKVGSLSRRR